MDASTTAVGVFNLYTDTISTADGDGPRVVLRRKRRRKREKDR